MLTFIVILKVLKDSRKTIYLPFTKEEKWLKQDFELKDSRMEKKEYGRTAGWRETEIAHRVLSGPAPLSSRFCRDQTVKKPKIVREHEASIKNREIKVATCPVCGLK